MLFMIDTTREEASEGILGTDYSTTTAMRTFFRHMISAVLRLLPSDAPMFIYIHLLKPRLIRTLTNKILCALIPQTLTLPEGILFLNQQDPVVSGALMLGAYEPFFSKIFRAHLKPGMTIIDVGANIGYYTIIASAHVKSSGKVIAYEPEHANVNFLHESIRANKFMNIIVVEEGLGDREQNASLYLDPDNKGKHSLLQSGNENKAQISIPVTTLDSSLTKLGVSKVDLIKMDIEGWEGKALRGMAAIIHRDHPTLLFEFVPERIRETGEDPTRLLAWLHAEMYELSLINEKTKTLEPIIDNALLVQSLLGNAGYVNLLAVKK